MRRGNGIGWIFLILLAAGLAYAAFAPTPAPPAPEPVLTRSANLPDPAQTEKFLAATPRAAPQQRQDPPPVAGKVLRLEDEKVVWVAPGLTLLDRPAPNAAPLHIFQSIGKIRYAEQRGDYYRIRHEGHEGWVHLPGYDRRDPNAPPPLGEAPDTLAPLLARDPDPALLAKARSLLGAGERSGQLGPFELYTDLGEAAFDRRLEGLARAAEPAYQARYGRVPVGEAKGAIVLFAAESAYRAYEEESENLRGRAAAGHNSLGVVALFAGDRHPDDVAATLAHELGHLLNRRILGPALPPWLDEGLCEDFAFSRLGPEGQLFPAEIGGRILRRPGSAEFGGPYSSLHRLRTRLLAHQLPAPAELAGGGAFQGRDAYDQAGAFFRFLVDGEGGKRRAGLRAFLAAVAAGGPPEFARLQAALGESAELTDAAFRAWVLDRANLLLGPP